MKYSAKYPAFIEGGGDDYGVVFPDLPGIVAMGDTLEEAMANAEEALRDYALESESDGLAPTPPSTLEHIQVPAGYTLTHVTLARSSSLA